MNYTADIQHPYNVDSNVVSTENPNDKLPIAMLDVPTLKGEIRKIDATVKLMDDFASCRSKDTRVQNALDKAVKVGLQFQLGLLTIIKWLQQDLARARADVRARDRLLAEKAKEFERYKRKHPANGDTDDSEDDGDAQTY